jgi:predicted DNA-binding protein
MIKPTRPTPGNADMVTVYGKVPRQMAERLDVLADQRRWSRAQMVAYCIEKFLEKGEEADQTSRGGH